jgi:hypothetical protein
MKLPAFRLLWILLLTAFGFASAQTPPPAPDPALTEPRLVIANRSFVRKGQKTSATVRNLVDLIEERYRGTNINVVDADNIMIGDLTVRWPVHSAGNPEARREGALRNLLATLSHASGRKFHVQDSGPDDFLIVGERHSEAHATEIINLGPLLQQPDISAFELAVAEAETHLARLRERIKGPHPELVEATKVLEIRKRQLGEQVRNRPTAEKLIEQIHEVTDLTLQNMNPRPSLPNFKFHRGTNLLIVSGPEESIALTRKVVAALAQGR